MKRNQVAKNETFERMWSPPYKPLRNQTGGPKGTAKERVYGMKGNEKRLSIRFGECSGYGGKKKEGLLERVTLADDP